MIVFTNFVTCIQVQQFITVRRQTPPKADTPLGRHPTPQTDTPWADIPPARHPLGRHPLPPRQTPPEQIPPPPGRWLLQRTVRILLECFPVLHAFSLWAVGKPKILKSLKNSVPMRTQWLHHNRVYDPTRQ